MSFHEKVEDKAVSMPPKPCQALRESVNELRAALKTRQRSQIQEALGPVETNWPLAHRAQIELSHTRVRDDDKSMRELQMFADALNDANAARADAMVLLAHL